MKGMSRLEATMYDILNGTSHYEKMIENDHSNIKLLLDIIRTTNLETSTVFSHNSIAITEHFVIFNGKKLLLKTTTTSGDNIVSEEIYEEVKWV
jgi:hypothetical protein